MKRLLSLVILFTLVITMLPTSVKAADTWSTVSELKEESNTEPGTYSYATIKLQNNNKLAAVFLCSEELTLDVETYYDNNPIVTTNYNLKKSEQLDDKYILILTIQGFPSDCQGKQVDLKYSPKSKVKSLSCVVYQGFEAGDSTSVDVMEGSRLDSTLYSQEYNKEEKSTTTGDTSDSTDTEDRDASNQGITSSTYVTNAQVDSKNKMTVKLHIGSVSDIHLVISTMDDAEVYDEDVSGKKKVSVGKVDSGTLYKCCLYDMDDKLLDTYYAISSVTYKVSDTNKTIKARKFTLKWKKVKGVTSYNIYESKFANKGFVKIGESEKPKFKYKNTEEGVRGKYYWVQPVYDSPAGTIRSTYAGSVYTCM